DADGEEEARRQVAAGLLVTRRDPSEPRTTGLWVDPFRLVRRPRLGEVVRERGEDEDGAVVAAQSLLIGDARRRIHHERRVDVDRALGMPLRLLGYAETTGPGPVDDGADLRE